MDKVQKQIDQGEAKLASLLVVSEPDVGYPSKPYPNTSLLTTL